MESSNTTDREGGYGTVSKAVLRNPNIHQGAKALYSLLCCYAGNKGYAYPSVRTLADDLGAGLGTVQRYLEELIQYGVIIKITGDSISSNRYKINHTIQVDKKSESTTDSKNECVSKIDTPVSEMDTGVYPEQIQGVSKMEKEVYPKWIPKKNIKKNNNEEYNIPPIVPQGGGSDSVYSFDEFWDDYGKKIGKEKCKKKYAKISEKNRKKIMQQLPYYLASTPNTTYRKHPLTWLNGKHWEDDVSSLTNPEPTATTNQRYTTVPTPTFEERHQQMKDNVDEMVLLMQEKQKRGEL